MLKLEFDLESQTDTHQHIEQWLLLLSGSSSLDYSVLLTCIRSRVSHLNQHNTMTITGIISIRVSYFLSLYTKLKNIQERANTMPHVDKRQNTTVTPV